jgi:hypothetical protein
MRLEMETLVFILALSNVVCGIALLMATRTIKTLSDCIEKAIDNDMWFEKIYRKLARGEKNGREHKNNSK